MKFNFFFFFKTSTKNHLFLSPKNEKPTSLIPRRPTLYQPLAILKSCSNKDRNISVVSSYPKPLCSRSCKSLNHRLSSPVPKRRTTKKRNRNNQKSIIMSTIRSWMNSCWNTSRKQRMTSNHCPTQQCLDDKEILHRLDQELIGIFLSSSWTLAKI